VGVLSELGCGRQRIHGAQNDASLDAASKARRNADSSVGFSEVAAVAAAVRLLLLLPAKPLFTRAMAAFAEAAWWHQSGEKSSEYGTRAAVVLR
jgi:hypothetical protein